MDSCQVDFGDSNRGMAVLRPVPADRNSPVFSGSPMVAESPIRRGLTCARRDRRSIRQRVCPPLSPLSRECTSSMTTQRRSPKRRGMAMCLCITMDSKDAGVICRIPEGFLINLSL